VRLYYEKRTSIDVNQSPVYSVSKKNMKREPTEESRQEMKDGGRNKNRIGKEVMMKGIRLKFHSIPDASYSSPTSFFADSNYIFLPPHPSFLSREIEIFLHTNS